MQHIDMVRCFFIQSARDDSNIVIVRKLSFCSRKVAKATQPGSALKTGPSHLPTVGADSGGASEGCRVWIGTQLLWSLLSHSLSVVIINWLVYYEFPFGERHLEASKVPERDLTAIAINPAPQFDFCQGFCVVLASLNRWFAYQGAAHLTSPPALLLSIIGSLRWTLSFSK